MSIRPSAFEREEAIYGPNAAAPYGSDEHRATAFVYPTPAADDGLTMARISTASLSTIAELLELAADRWDDDGDRSDDGAAYIRAEQARERVAGIQRAIDRAERVVPGGERHAAYVRALADLAGSDDR